MSMSGDSDSNQTLEAEGARCPIIRSWINMPALMNRAAGGKIAEVGKEGIGREAVSTNAEILEPVISEFGTLAGTT